MVVARWLQLGWMMLALIAANAAPREAVADNPDAKPRPNVLLICVDDLRPELHCFGVDYIHSPNIDALAADGVCFTRHYVQAPTCGASRYAMLTGTYGGASNSAIFDRARAMPDSDVAVSMPEWFRANGYTTVSVGKVSHHPGGRGGRDWDDDAQPEMPAAWDRHLLPAGDWQHPRGWMHGLANGEIRGDASKMDLFQSISGDDSIYPDGGSIDVALEQIDELTRADDQATVSPFFLAVGILRPHLPFGAPAKYMQPYRDAELPVIPHPDKPLGKTTWHGSGEFMKYNRWGRNPNSDPEFAIEVRKHYAACVSYADAMVGKLLDRLQARGALDNTLVVLWGDHGWHLGEHAIWGKHALFEESLRSPLIVRVPEAIAALASSSGALPRNVSSDAVVESVDIFPTLCELSALPLPQGLVGTSLLPLLREPNPVSNSAPTATAVSYTARANTIRTERYRLIEHQDGHLELYDHSSPEGETKNIAKQQPDVAASLVFSLTERLK